MTLEQKASFVILSARDGYENVNTGIPSLCIPPLTLQDGPSGVAYRATGVTQLPAPIGVAASFDPTVARATGQVIGAEARTKGIDVIQGPDVNLARVPESGRTFEGFGEDPDLTGAMATANVEGIQSTRTMAAVKHFTAYTQETSRVRLQQDVSLRALIELYDAPFVPVVHMAHPAAVMCSYGSLNGVNTCSDPATYRVLASLGFTGFVRSDLRSVGDPATAFGAGLDLIKPDNVAHLVGQVQSGQLDLADLNRAVKRILAPMFAFGLIAHRGRGAIGARAITRHHTAVALEAAERSMVLLKDQGGVLPLAPSTSSLAVIGADAGAAARTAGFGSSHVVPPLVSSPLSALTTALGPSTQVTYTPADATRLGLPPLTRADLVSGEPLPAELPHGAAPGGTGQEPGKRDLHIDFAPNVTPAAATATNPGTGPGWSSWHAVLEVHQSGTYEVSLEQNGDSWLYVDGFALIASRGLHGRSRWSTTIPLVAGQRYTISLSWFGVTGQPTPQVGFMDATGEINAAVAAARGASTAVVFVSDEESESVDRPDLSLPGDANALISAVAAVNHHTVVVLNTGGAVLMPWIHDVAAVLEAWYPGEEDGMATAAVLTGHVDPSGHLPLTFPADDNPSPVGSPAQYPGIDATVDFSEGLDIGYRWFQAHKITPLFPFGYGLSYTSFALSKATLHRHGTDDVADLTVKNTGQRAGRAVVQAYLAYPRFADEPPRQLRAFQSVTLRAGQTRSIQLQLPASAFDAYEHGKLRAVAGRYDILIGQSSANLPIQLHTTAP